MKNIVSVYKQKVQQIWIDIMTWLLPSEKLSSDIASLPQLSTLKIHAYTTFVPIYKNLYKKKLYPFL